MGKILFYGPAAIILVIASWYYSQGESAPDTIMPLNVLLFGIMSLGYGLKAKEDGEIGAGSGKIKRDKNPRLFQIGLYINYVITIGFFVGVIYLII